MDTILDIPDIINIINEYINGDRLYWKRQYDFIIRDINFGCVPYMLYKEVFIHLYDEPMIKSGILLQHENVMNQLESTFLPQFRHFGYPTGILRWYRACIYEKNE